MDPNNFLWIIAGVAGIAIILAFLFNHQYEPAKVLDVLDGDSLLVSTNKYKKGVKVRLCGIDCPEDSQYLKQSKSEERMAREINRYVETRLPPNTTIFLEYDKRKWDQFGRLLAYVYIGKTSKSLNAELIRKGLAYAKTFKDNYKYDKQFRELEAQAQRQKIGIWAKMKPK